MQSVTQEAKNDNGEWDLIDAVRDALERAVAALEARTSFVRLEEVALAISNEALRRMLERELQRIADRESDVVEYDGRYRRHQVGHAKYHSLCGPLQVRRWTYRRVGERNGPTVVPLELRAGLMENATPALAKAIAFGYAKAPIRSVLDDLRAAQRLPPSYATLSRIAKAIGTDAKQVLMQIEQRVRSSEDIPSTATGITIGLDRTTIPMEEEEREVDARGRTTTRIAVRYRMAYVGSVALTSSTGDVLKSWRYAVPAHEGGRQVVTRMLRDVRHARDVNPAIAIGVVQDNAPEMWNLVREGLREQTNITDWHECVDVFHLFERLAKALEVVEPDEQKRAAQLRKWKQRMTRDDGTITRIANFFELDLNMKQWREWGKNRRVTTHARFTHKQWLALDALLGAYLGNREHFRYVKMLGLGLHIGSGVTEGACKSMITMRAKRSGQRWKRAGISAVLSLRSIVESGRFEAFWKRFARRYAPLARAA
jgi:hypothetical protein